MKILKYIVPLLAVILYLCRTVPYTQRKQLILFPIETERKLGNEAFTEIKKTEKFSSNPEYTKMVQRIGWKIVKAAGVRGKEKWEFKVIDKDDVINAFALPGGKVCVYTGLLKMCESEDEVAVVVGHEIGHVVARHGGERMSELLLAQLGGMALEVALKEKRGKTMELAQIAYGVGVQLGVLLPFSRKHEEEADYMGLIFMTKAGYNPERALTFWQKMEKKSKGKIPEFLSTHPSHGTRIKNIKKWLPEIKRKYGK
jgi:predicted Zn-dependent protease